MSHDSVHFDEDSEGYRRRLRWAVVVFLAMGVFLLWQEHRAHLWAVLPWVLLLACPVVHFLRHRRSRSRHEGHASAGEEAARTHEHGRHGCC
jgi:hypothetical protein